MVTSIQGRNRRQLRQAVGRNLGSAAFRLSTTTSEVDSASVVDTSLTGGSGDHVGNYILATSGTNDGEISRASAFDGTSDITIIPSFSASVPSGMTYEKWADEYSPAQINGYIDDAILDATGRVFDAETDETLHLHPDEWRYDIPSQFFAITKLEDRIVLSDTLIDAVDATVTTVDTDVTQSADTEIKRKGNASLRMAIAAGLAANDDLVLATIGSVDISKHDRVEFWIRSTVALTANQFQLRLNDAAGNEEALNIGAVSADTWTYQSLAVASQETNTAITQWTLRDTADIGVATIWIDEIRAFQRDRVIWHEIPRHHWKIDQQNRDLVFRVRPQYRLLRITGGDRPLLLTSSSDSTTDVGTGDALTNEIDDYFVIAYATAMALEATSGGNSEDAKERRRRADRWTARAERAKAGWPMLMNVRKIN